MEDTKKSLTTMEISEVEVTEIVNSDFCKIYEIKETPFNVRHFLNEDMTTKEVVICIGDEAIAKYSSIEGAMYAIKNKDWQIVLIGSWVYGKKMDKVKFNKQFENE